MPAAERFSEQALSLASELGVPCVDVAARAPWCLVFTREALELRNDSATGTLRISTRPERHRHVSRRDPLGRAIGKGSPLILDATAGLGGDALLLSRMGFRVSAIERSRLVAALLRDRIRRENVAINVTQGDAATLLESYTPVPDVVYLDAMFPARRRTSALARKEMLALGELTHGDDDNRGLLEAALGSAKSRVVVKRLPESPDLGREPSHSHAGKVVRYDVYLTST